MLTKNNFPFFPLSLFSFILTMSLGYGLQYRFHDSGLGQYFRILSIIFLLILIGISFYVIYCRNRREFMSKHIAVALCSLSLTLTCYFSLGSIVGMPIWFGVTVFAVTAAVWIARRNMVQSLYFLGVVGFIINLVLIALIPHAHGANMLQIIEAAGQDFLAGNNPYHLYEDIASAPFGYLPGLWLPYLPLIWLGLDLRILNVVFLLLLVWIYERGLGNKTNDRSIVLGSTLYPLLLSPLVSQMLVHGHIWPYWIFLMTIMLLLSRASYIAAALFFGLALAARQPALWLAPPIAGYLVNRVGWVGAAKYASLSLIVYLLLIMPFVFMTDGAFFKMVYLNVINIKLEQSYIGAIVWSDYLGINILLQPFQLLSLLAVMYWLYRQKVDFGIFLMVTGIAYIWVVFFNSYPIRYVYIPGFLLLIAGFSWRYSPIAQPAAE